MRRVHLVQAPLGKYIPHVVRIAVRHMGDPITVEKCLVALARVADPANKVHTCPPASWGSALARAVAVVLKLNHNAAASHPLPRHHDVCPARPMRCLRQVHLLDMVPTVMTLLERHWGHPLVVACALRCILALGRILAVVRVPPFTAECIPLTRNTLQISACSLDESLSLCWDGTRQARVLPVLGRAMEAARWNARDPDVAEGALRILRHLITGEYAYPVWNRGLGAVSCIIHVSSVCV